MMTFSMLYGIIIVMSVEYQINIEALIILFSTIEGVEYI